MQGVGKSDDCLIMKSGTGGIGRWMWFVGAFVIGAALVVLPFWLLVTSTGWHGAFLVPIVFGSASLALAISSAITPVAEQYVFIRSKNELVIVSRPLLRKTVRHEHHSIAPFPSVRVEGVDWDAHGSSTQHFELGLRMVSGKRWYLFRYRSRIEAERDAERIRSFLAQPVVPNDATSYYKRANAYLDRGDTEAAINDYAEAIRVKPDYADAYVNRGLAYHDKKYYRDAIADFTKAIRLNADHADTYLYRGLAYASIEADAEAIADFEKALQLSDDQALCQEAEQALRELGVK